MAFVADKISLKLECQDNTAKSYTKTFELNPAHPDCANLATIASAAGLTNIAAIIAKWEAVSQTEVLSYNVSQKYREDTPVNGAGDWNDYASISVNLATAGKKATLKIQAPENGIFIGDAAFGPDSETVDAADTALLEFLALYADTQVDSDTDPEGTLLLSDGEEMNDTPGATGHKV